MTSKVAHFKSDSNVASFGGTFTTVKCLSDGKNIKSVVKNATLTEDMHGDLLNSNALDMEDGGLNSSLVSLDSSVTSSLTDSSSILDNMMNGYGQSFILDSAAPVESKHYQSLLMVNRGASNTVWNSHAKIGYLYRVDKMFYIDSAGSVHGPLDQSYSSRVVSFQKSFTMSANAQGSVATKSHQCIPTPVITHNPSSRAYLTLYHDAKKAMDETGRSKIQVNQYSDNYNGGTRTFMDDAVTDRELRLALELQKTRQALQNHSMGDEYEYRENWSKTLPRNMGRSNVDAFDTRLDELERSLNYAMDNIKRSQKSSVRNRNLQAVHKYNSYNGFYNGYNNKEERRMKRYDSEPPFEFRYHQKTVTQEPPDTYEEIETTTLQPIGKGIQDLGGSRQFLAGSLTYSQNSRSKHMYRSNPHMSSSTAATHQRNLPVNRAATLRASTPQPQHHSRTAQGPLSPRSPGHHTNVYQSSQHRQRHQSERSSRHQPYMYTYPQRSPRF